MKRKNHRSLSKFLSYLLRHGAEEYGLLLDMDGSVELEQVWAIVENRYGKQYDKEDLQFILDGKTDGKKRLVLEDGRIRAIYGHNRKISTVAYTPITPPPLLYHGTNHRVISQIKESGLLPMERQYVHLSIHLERAISVARRQTPNPIILSIRALEAQQAGHKFYQPDENHFLCTKIAATFIDFPEKK